MREYWVMLGGNWGGNGGECSVECSMDIELILGGSWVDLKWILGGPWGDSSGSARRAPSQV